MTRDDFLYALADLGCYDVVAIYQPLWREAGFERHGVAYGFICFTPDQQLYRHFTRWTRSEEEFYAERGKEKLLELRAIIEDQAAKTLVAA